MEFYWVFWGDNFLYFLYNHLLGEFPSTAMSQKYRGLKNPVKFPY